MVWMVTELEPTDLSNMDQYGNNTYHGQYKHGNGPTKHQFYTRPRFKASDRMNS